MIPAKEKALEIFSKMFAEWHQIPYESVKAHIEIVGMELSDSYFMARGSALVAVNEILNNNCGSHTDESNATNNEIYCDEYFWQDVKTELEKFGEVGFLAKK